MLFIVTDSPTPGEAGNEFDTFKPAVAKCHMGKVTMIKSRALDFCAHHISAKEVAIVEGAVRYLAAIHQRFDESDIGEVTVFKNALLKVCISKIDAFERHGDKVMRRGTQAVKIASDNRSVWRKSKQ